MGRRRREEQNGALAPRGGTDVARTGITELFPESDEFQHQLISL